MHHHRPRPYARSQGRGQGAHHGRREHPGSGAHRGHRGNGTKARNGGRPGRGPGSLAAAGGAGAGALRGMLDFLLGLPGNRGATWLLVAINAAGSAWGFWWYHDQLAATPRWMWPVVPDSPAASTLFTIAIVLQLAGRRSRALEAFAYLTMVKYGLWTVIVLTAYGARTGSWHPEALMLIASHAGMAIEAAIYQRWYPAARTAVLVAWAWAVFNDLVDYGAGLHPYLPGPEVAGVAWQAAVALTVFAGGFVYRHATAYHVTAGGDPQPGRKAEND